MPGKIALEVVEGAMSGKMFAFEEHDTFLFGRSKDCHACLPDDPLVSRHHFIVEVNPPDARVRDLGSLNGTYVNGTKHGGRQKGETPEKGAKHQFAEVGLKDGDKVKVGNTVFAVQVEMPMFCCECGREIPADERTKCSWVAGTYVCQPCKGKLLATGQKAKAPEPPKCQKCGKDVAAEVNQARPGEYICEACRQKARGDAMGLMAELLRQARIQRGPALPVIEGYDIDKKLGQGGMGAVYLARRKADGERVAIKVMLANVAVQQLARDRFNREMDLTQRLRHPNIVQFIEHGSAGAVFYFILEFCDGGGLDHLMQQHGGKLSLQQAGPMMLQILEGLAFAHQMAIVHRDLKPQNILFCGSGTALTAKISDFGLAKNFQAAGLTKDGTVTGTTAGTPLFMPREQVTNFKHIKPSGDVWSIAATFYHMLTGSIPREIRRGVDPIAAILSGAIVPIRQRDPGVPKKFADVVDRALLNDPMQRYQDAGEMRRALENAL